MTLAAMADRLMNAIAVNGRVKNMNYEDSINWQSDSVATYLASLRASLGNSVDDNVVAAMEALYRAGWGDCYRLAKRNGVSKYD